MKHLGDRLLEVVRDVDECFYPRVHLIVPPLPGKRNEAVQALHDRQSVQLLGETREREACGGPMRGLLQGSRQGRRDMRGR